MSAGTTPTARLAGLSLAVILSVGGGACGDDGGPPTSVTVGEVEVPATRLAEALQGICLARRQAGGNVQAARTTFFDRSHDTLHLLALALEAEDRQKAGELLLAKQLVEADLESTPVRPALAQDLSRLAAVTRSGLARLEISTPPCE